ncbi:MAG: PEP-CTERM sorting domain-containing protein [Planctomycetota bacterium]
MIRALFMFGLLFLGMVVVAPNAHSGVLMLPNGQRVFSTGLDDSGNRLANGAFDTHYEFVLNPANSLTNPFVASAGYLSANTSNSQWIGPVGAFVDAPDAPSNNIYSMITSIDLTGLNVAGFRIDGFWVSDNTGLDILVNGLSTGQGNSGSHTRPPSSRTENAFTLSSGLVTGLNEIQFQWINLPHGPANPTHARVEFSSFSTTSTVPEPSTLLSFLALGGTAVVSRRHRRTQVKSAAGIN